MSDVPQTAALYGLIKTIKIAMLTTADSDGRLRSRPMVNEQQDFDGILWFFTRDDAPKTGEIAHDAHVNLAFADPQNQNYVSVTGTARIVKDASKMRELWSEDLRAWFPGGLDEPHLALLKVEIALAEYWNAPSARMMLLAEMTRPPLAGSPPGSGRHGKVDLH